MSLGRFGTMVAAAALACAGPAWADYAAGKTAWDAGRPAAALVEWRAAADGGDRRSMLSLGRLYVRGLGAPQDFVLAHMWFNLAASRGEAAALKERDALAARMTPAAVAEAQKRAQKRARDWRPGPGAVFRDCPECPEMVVVPAGSFTMGSPSSWQGREGDEGPAYRVTIPAPFAVGKYEVTRGEFARFVSATGHDDTGSSCSTREGGKWKDRSGRSWRSPGYSQTDRDPAICVNWEDARAYARWLSGRTGKKYRLLSESEWEYAARAGTRTRYSWGNAIGRNRANCAGCGSRWDGKKTAPVGSFKANGFGLHDMHGNVLEWVEDCYNESYAGASSDGRAWESGHCGVRVLRGGSWYYVPRDLRAASRVRGVTGVRNYYFGFRVARTLTP